MKPKVLLINGSLGGKSGNSGRLLDMLLAHLGDCEIHELILSSFDPSTWPKTEVASKIQWADGFVFASGTYWDSWGSPLQIFFEQMTPLEGSEHWLGKPALCLITMHSVGGKAVLSRMQGVLSTLGLVIPPMSGLVYSMTGQDARASLTRDPSFDDDIWSLDDLKKMAHNFLSIAKLKQAGLLRFESWPVDRREPDRIWFKS